jgi:hypothetical protein
MEILESIAWITLGFVPIFGSMELAWRLRKKLVISKFKVEGETSHIEVSPHSTKSSPSDEFDWVWEDVIKEKEIKEKEIPTTALRSRAKFLL